MQNCNAWLGHHSRRCGRRCQFNVQSNSSSQSKITPMNLHNNKFTSMLVCVIVAALAGSPVSSVACPIARWLPVGFNILSQGLRGIIVPLLGASCISFCFNLMSSSLSIDHIPCPLRATVAFLAVCAFSRHPLRAIVLRLPLLKSISCPWSWRGLPSRWISAFPHHPGFHFVRAIGMLGSSNISVFLQQWSNAHFTLCNAMCSAMFKAPNSPKSHRVITGIFVGSLRAQRHALSLCSFAMLHHWCPWLVFWREATCCLCPCLTFLLQLAFSLLALQQFSTPSHWTSSYKHEVTHVLDDFVHAWVFLCAPHMTWILLRNLRNVTLWKFFQAHHLIWPLLTFMKSRMCLKSLCMVGCFCAHLTWWHWFYFHFSYDKNGLFKEVQIYLTLSSLSRSVYIAI